VTGTFGVEEEFLLVDPDSGEPVDGARRVLDRAGELPNAASDATLQTELLDTQVEAATGVCRTLGELRAQVWHGRRQLAGAARGEGLWLVASGTPVLDGGAPPAANAGERFTAIMRTYAGVVAGYQCCGCHVHVGVPDRETAVAVVNHLAPWLPTLLALSANSAFEHGRDTGYGSWRMVTQSRFPGSGITPWFASAAAYDRRVDQLVECGVLADRNQSFWLARPSARLPTVELRVADVAGTADDAVLQAALSRALVDTALTELAAGREAAPMDGQLAAAALWTAARYGLCGPGVDLRTARPAPAGRLLTELITLIRPSLEDNGDLTAVRDGIATVTATGTGAEHQRRVAANGPLAVLRLLATRTLQPPS
jgi:carboxylate-amine ligase